MDCLRAAPYSSHFGIAAAYKAVKRMLHPPWHETETLSESEKPTHRPDEGKVYLVGFSHWITIAEWECVGQVLRGERSPLEFLKPTITTVPPAATGHGGLASPAYDQNWKLPDGGVRSTFVRSALDALREQIPFIESAITLASSADFNENPMPLLETKDRVWVKPAWDGMRVFVRGTEVYEHNPAVSFAGRNDESLH